MTTSQLRHIIAILAAAACLVFCALWAHGDTTNRTPFVTTHTFTVHSTNWVETITQDPPPPIVVISNVPIPCTLAHCPPPVTDPPNVIRVGPTRTYKTIQAAVNVANAGAVVLIDNGTYAGFYAVRSGTATAPITIKADGTNVIVNSRNAQTIDNVNSERFSYIVIDGIRSINAARHGFRILGGVGVVIRNCQSLDAGHTGALLAQCLEVRVENSIFARAKVEHGLYIGESGGTEDKPIVRGCEFYGNAGNGFQINGNGPGDATIKGALVDGNFSHSNRLKGFSLIGMIYSTVSGNTSSNNATSGSGAAGIHLAKDPQSGPSSHSNTLLSNTVYETRMAAIRFTEASTNNLVDWNNTRGGIVNNASGSQRMGTHNTVIP